MDTSWLCVVLGFSATIGCVALLRPVAIQWGLVDRPGGRKQHRGEIPLVGGTALFAVIVGSWATLRIDWPVWMPAYLLAAGILVASGALDDRYDLNPRGRFLLQIICAVMVIHFGHLALNNLGDLFGMGEVRIGAPGALFTVFAVLGVTNAINMFDGANGLASGTCLISTLGFSVAASAVGAEGTHSALLLLSGGLGGFLIFNFRPRAFDSPLAFLGDAGALFLGFTLSLVAVFLSQREGPHMPPIIAVWIGGLPLLEIARLVGRRLAHGVNPMRPDRSHLHHCLLALGMSERSVVATIWLCQLLLTSVGLVGWWSGYSEALLFYGFVLLFLVYSAVIEWIYFIAVGRVLAQAKRMSKQAKGLAK